MSLCIELFNSFIRNVVKWPNILKNLAVFTPCKNSNYVKILLKIVKKKSLHVKNMKVIENILTVN